MSNAAHIKPPTMHTSPTLPTTTQTPTTSGTGRNAAKAMQRDEPLSDSLDDSDDLGNTPSPLLSDTSMDAPVRDDDDQASSDQASELPSSPPPLPPSPHHPPTPEPIHITLTRLPTLTAHQPALHIRINTIRRHMCRQHRNNNPSTTTMTTATTTTTTTATTTTTTTATTNPTHADPTTIAALRAARVALSTTRARLAAICAGYGMRDRDCIVDWDEVAAAMVDNGDGDDDDDDDDGQSDDIDDVRQAAGVEEEISESLRREVDGWLARRMGWYTGRGSTRVYLDPYENDNDKGDDGSYMVKGRCEMQVVFASEAQMRAVVGTMEAAGGAMGDGVGLMGMVLRFWNDEWRVENPDLAIEGDDLGVGDMLRLEAIRPLERELDE